MCRLLELKEVLNSPLDSAGAHPIALTARPYSFSCQPFMYYLAFIFRLELFVLLTSPSGKLLSPSIKIAGKLLVVDACVGTSMRNLLVTVWCCSCARI